MRPVALLAADFGVGVLVGGLSGALIIAAGVVVFAMFVVTNVSAVGEEQLREDASEAVAEQGTA